MPLQPVVSARGMRMANFPTPDFLDIYFEGLKNLYSKDNPTGNVNLAMAENRLTKEMVREKIQKESKGSVDLISMGYQDFWGRPELREAYSNIMEEKLGGKVGADNLAVINGAGSALALSAFALCDPEDSILVPSPLYYGFERDVTGLPEAKLVPIKELTLKCLNDSYKTQTEAGHRPKVLILTHPDNPTGRIITEQEIRGSVEWAQAHGVHVLMDEMYALSVFRDSPIKFKSCLEIFTELPQNVHLIWGLSKDFCGSGLRCVVIHTRNQQFKDAMNKFLYFYQVGGPLQNQVTSMFNDKEWVDKYIVRMNNDLLTSCEIAENFLSENGIGFARPQAAFFLYCDFTPWSDKIGGENSFLNYISTLPGGGVLLIGSTGVPEDTGLRLCFASSTIPDLKVGLQRLADACKAIDNGATVPLYTRKVKPRL